MKKKKDYEALFGLGVGLIGIAPVFIIAINKAIGLAFLAMGCAYLGIYFSKRKKK